ncbi:(2R)-phospho-3-sulpholactate synthase, ComA [Moorella glycerini]|uniref:Phosphosulfolactate synthase n=1 Tax=Neomoorella stamsii TaxID=1266720 RepID=A0A9X7J6M5_9FIRM|nr:MULTISPECIES: phosphosulfolactate synthase [Moorella]PRR77818.1 Phosphosulfolactate synthase [Moorella stamsii]CEP68927.1 (2R)-phospho-3-sulpholactate synthase, ComA [Moorella glycerini]
MQEKATTTWKDVLEFPIGGRQQKPRQAGLTMVIDKGLGLTEFRDLLEVAAPYIDFIKLGFGTSVFYPAAILREKIRLARSYNVDIFPGGTFFEVAVLQGRLNLYLQTARELGYTFIEISDGTIDMSRTVRLAAVRQARAAGFGVITEVGKKDPRDALSEALLLSQITGDQEAGADYVIVEGRESGQGVVIYDGRGAVKEDILASLLAGIKDLDRVIWEAPQKQHQQALIMRLGPNVNLGNVQPGDVLALEALRVGLRGDTLRTTLKVAEVS